MKVLILLALAAYTQAIAPGEGSYHCDICTCDDPVIRTFDAKYGVIRKEQKTTLFRGKNPDMMTGGANDDGFDGALDSCKTQIRCVTSNDCYWNTTIQHLWLDWCGIALNVHLNPSKSHRNWIVGQLLLHISERGQGLGGDTPLPFNNGEITYPDLLPVPDRDPACDPLAIAQVSQDGQSIEISTPCCGWAVRWTPRVACTCIEIFMDDSWANTTQGMCGNSDGVSTDDPDNCGPGVDDYDGVICSSLSPPAMFDCWSGACAGGNHDGQAFVGCTRIHENDYSAMAGACLE